MNEMDVHRLNEIKIDFNRSLMMTYVMVAAVVAERLSKQHLAVAVGMLKLTMKMIVVVEMLMSVAFEQNCSAIENFYYYYSDGYSWV